MNMDMDKDNKLNHIRTEIKNKRFNAEQLFLIEKIKQDVKANDIGDLFIYIFSLPKKERTKFLKALEFFFENH